MNAEVRIFTLFKFYKLYFPLAYNPEIDTERSVTYLHLTGGLFWKYWGSRGAAVLSLAINATFIGFVAIRDH